jgi:hypothetical protein
MSTSQSAAKVIETRYVWGPTVESCMDKAQAMCKYGRWAIQGNPAPMTWNGAHGTGVAISRLNDE